MAGQWYCRMSAGRLGRTIRLRPVRLRHRSHQPLEHHINDRAKGRILERERRSFYQHVFIRIGKPFAIRWPHLIDAATIIGAQKWTGRTLNDIIALVVDPEIPIDEFAFLQPEMPRDAFDVRCLEPRRIALTAIGALQTIDTPEGFGMRRRQLFQHPVSHGCPTGLLQPSLVRLPPVGGLFSQLFNKSFIPYKSLHSQLTTGITIFPLLQKMHYLVYFLGPWKT